MGRKGDYEGRKRAWKCRELGASLVVQWLRLGLRMLGVRVWSLLRELGPPHASWLKNRSIKNRGDIVKNSMKSLKKWSTSKIEILKIVKRAGFYTGSERGGKQSRPLSFIYAESDSGKKWWQVESAEHNTQAHGFGIFWAPASSCRKRTYTERWPKQTLGCLREVSSSEEGFKRGLCIVLGVTEA